MYGGNHSYTEKKSSSSLNKSASSKTGDSTRDESRSFT